MKAGAILALVVLTLAAQPRLLTNAKVDTRSAAAGVEREFRALRTMCVRIHRKRQRWCRWNCAR